MRSYKLENPIEVYMEGLSRTEEFTRLGLNDARITGMNVGTVKNPNNPKAAPSEALWLEFDKGGNYPIRKLRSSRHSFWGNKTPYITREVLINHLLTSARTANNSIKISGRDYVGMPPKMADVQQFLKSKFNPIDVYSSYSSQIGGNLAGYFNSNDQYQTKAIPLAVHDKIINQSGDLTREEALTLITALSTYLNAPGSVKRANIPAELFFEYIVLGPSK